MNLKSNDNDMYNNTTPSICYVHADDLTNRVVAAVNGAQRSICATGVFDGSSLPVAYVQALADKTNSGTVECRRVIFPQRNALCASSITQATHPGINKIIINNFPMQTMILVDDEHLFFSFHNTMLKFACTTQDKEVISLFKTYFEDAWIHATDTI